jgi:hypothetical protein
VDKHLNILGALNVAVGASGLLGAVIVFWSMAGGSLMAAQPGVVLLRTVMGTAIALLITAFSAPTLAAGIGLLQGKPWAPKLALAMGAVNLLNIPFGTPVGIYTIWIFVHQPERHAHSA